MKSKKTLEDYYSTKYKGYIYNYRYNKRCGKCGRFISIKKGYLCKNCFVEKLKELDQYPLTFGTDNYPITIKKSFWNRIWDSIDDFFHPFNDKEFY